MKDKLVKILKNIQEMEGPEKYKSFVGSLISWYEQKQKLTPAQQNYLKNIEQSYGDQAVAEEKKWKTDYSDDLKDIAVKCANYYNLEGSGYFKSIVQKVLDDKHITKNEFTKMCMNKYAKVVLQEYSSEPKYKVGDIIQIRKSNRLDLANRTKNQNKTSQYKAHKKAMNGDVMRGMILEVDPVPIARACHGARTYKLKLVNGGCLYANERDLKYASRKRKR